MKLIRIRMRNRDKWIQIFGIPVSNVFLAPGLGLKAFLYVSW